jgi:hypothetical protein
LKIPHTTQGVICVDEDDGTIICIMPPREISIKLLSQSKRSSAVKQAHLIKYLLDNIPDTQRGASHKSKSDHPYIVVGVKALQDTGVSTSLIGKTNEPKPEGQAQEEEIEVPVQSSITGKPGPFYPKKTLVGVARRCEQIVRDFVPTEELFALRLALEVAETPVAETFANFWSSAAIGTNFAAAMHQDLDSFFSMLVVSACLQTDTVSFSTRVSSNLQYDAQVAHHFIFPTYGLAIPLRPGDHLLFNPMVHHGCSYKLEAYNDYDVSLLAFYLKTAAVGGNDSYRFQLSKLQQEVWNDFLQFKHLFEN